jgi:F-type H+-transporting ATPase subunit epsilon
MADDNLLLISLVTPERVLLEGSASEVHLRTAAGDLAFLPGHTPLVGTIEPGVVRVVRAEGEVDRVASHGGFVQVAQATTTAEEGAGSTVSFDGTRVTMLVGVAELAGEIDVERARAALESSEARLAELGGGTGGRSAASAPAEGEVADPEMVEAEASLLRAQVRLEAVDAAAGAGTTSGAG